MARWTPGVKQAVIRDLKKGKSHIVSKREMWELINEGYPVEGLESRARGQEFLIRFKPGKQGKTMARKKRLWVELEVRPQRATRQKEWVYGIFNPRKNIAIDWSLPIFATEKEALDEGVKYLRATYNTGQPQKKR